MAPRSFMTALLATVLLVALAVVGVTSAAAQEGELPLVITAVQPGTVSAGRKSTITVIAEYAATRVKLKTPVLQQVDAEGNVLRTLGKFKFKKKAGRFVAKVKLKRPAPGVIWLRVDAGKKRVRAPASPMSSVLAVGDTSRLLELIASLPPNPQPTHPYGHVLRAKEIPDYAGAEFKSEVALAFGPDSETDFLMAGFDTGAVASGVRIAGSNKIWVSSIHGNAILDLRAGQLLNALADLGINVEALRSARQRTRFNHEADLGGFLLDRNRDVKGITILRARNLELWASSDHTDALGRTYRLCTALYNRVILRGDQVTSLNSGLPVETSTLRLREGYSTLLHELLHAVLHEGGWDEDDARSEDFVHELEELFNLQVTIALKRQRSEPVLDLMRAFVARLARALRDYPKGKEYVEQIGWGLPDGQKLEVDPPTLDFAVIHGDTEAPAPQSFTVLSRGIDSGVEAQVAFTLVRRGPDRLVGVDQLLTLPDYRQNTDRWYATPRTISVTVNPTTANDEETIPLPPGCYEDHLELASPSAPEPVRVRVRLTVFPRYTVTEIPLPGATPAGINGQGQVVGTFLQFLPDGGVQSHAFRWSRQEGTIFLEAGSSATGINDAGTMIGQALFPQPDETSKRRGCTWMGGGPAIPLPGPEDPFSQLQPWAINNSGMIAGRIPFANNTTLRAALWQGGAPMNLGTLGNPGGDLQKGWSEARGINDAGVVVGSSTTATGAVRAFVWRDGEMIDLGDHPDLPGWDFHAVGVSASGAVAGNATSSIGSAAFYWKDENGNGEADAGELQRIAPKRAWSNVLSMNSEGWFVGSMLLTGGLFAPYLSCGGAVMDLNFLVPADSGWMLRGAAAINSRGDIVGVGTYQGRTTLYLMEPIP